MRCRSWRSSGAASFWRSSGCPVSTICSSFSVSVSRFDSSRTSSSSLRVEVLRLVDDQHRVEAMLEVLEQKAVQRDHVVDLGIEAAGQAKLGRDQAQQIDRGKVRRVHDQRDFGVRRRCDREPRGAGWFCRSRPRRSAAGSPCGARSHRSEKPGPPRGFRKATRTAGRAPARTPARGGRRRTRTWTQRSPAMATPSCAS